MSSQPISKRVVLFVMWLKLYDTAYFVVKWTLFVVGYIVLSYYAADYLCKEWKWLYDALGSTKAGVTTVIALLLFTLFFVGFLLKTWYKETRKTIETWQVKPKGNNNGR